MISKNNNDHVVRLGQRAGVSRPEFVATTLSPRGGTPSRATAVACIATSTRASHEEHGRMHASARPSFTVHDVAGYFSKFAVILIVPVLIFRPLIPLYAADESIVPASVEAAPVAEVSVPAPAAEVSVPVVGAEEASSETAPEPAVESTEIDAGIEMDAATPNAVTDSVDPLNVPSDTADAVTDESLDTSIVPEEIIATESGEVVRDESATSSVEEVIATSTDTMATGTVEAAPDSAAIAEEVGAATEEVSADSGAENSDSTESVTSENVVEVSQDEAPLSIAPSGPSMEEIISQAVESRSEVMKRTIKHELETELLKGCVSLDGVGYYCLKEDMRMNGKTTAINAVTAVHASVVDGGSDKEIVVERGVDAITLTNNDVEDAFPSKDVGGSRVVWQSQEDGRWQIYFADLSSTTPVIEQITHGTESNFNPRVDGDSVVWQGWADGNWEIFLADRLAETSYYSEDRLPQLNMLLGVDRTWHVVRVTQNAVHDMFPAIAGGLVTWQSFEDGVWSVYAYNVRSGMTTKLSEGGVKSENPRFALTWDERDANGDARMVGYDIATGDTVDMTQAARNVADNGKPYQPASPTPTPEPLALPAPTSSVGSTTPMKGSGADGNGDDGLLGATSTDNTL